MYFNIKMEDLIKKRYNEFNKQYEDNEISPYNAAYDYFRAGYMAAFDNDTLKVLSQIIWEKYIVDRDGLSPIWMVIGEPNEYNRGNIYTKGSLLLYPLILAFSIPKTKRLTWRELALRLDIHSEDIVEDGHNCNICPFEDKCEASFKYKNSKEQPQCSIWQDKIDKKVYEKNLDRNKIMDDLFKCNDTNVK